MKVFQNCMQFKNKIKTKYFHTFEQEDVENREVKLGRVTITNF